MGLKAGIIGLPNVGKSTLFNAISSAKARSANFPFCTIEPNVGMIHIPDPRLDKIAEMVKPEKVVPNSYQIQDIAGLVEGASKGEGLGNQFLANIRDTDALIHVVRCFEDDNVIHEGGEIDPIRDKEIIDIELQLKDLETVEKRLHKSEKAAKSGEKDAMKEKEVLEGMKKHLEEGKHARDFEKSESAEEILKDLHLLTDKPVIYCANVAEDSLHDDNDHVKKLKDHIANEDAGMIKVCAGIEAEIAEIEDPSEQKEYLAMYQLEEPGVNKLIRETYRLLDLETFFTAGPEEVRAWPVKSGSRAPEAAGEIHSDFQRGFIKAEVIKFEDFVKYGSENAVKEAGKLQLEGKEYIVKDGDIVYFRFNV